MIRVLVCGEGIHDIGTTGPEQDDGWLQPLLRKLAGDDLEIVTVRRQQLYIDRREKRRLQPLPQGHGANALACKVRANLGDYDLVVFMADADSNERQVWRRKRSDILNGFSRIPGVEGIACVPMSASESWLLADEGAWREVGLRDTAELPSQPEMIWGRRNDPQSNHPHQFFRRICTRADVSDSRSTRVSLAVRSRIQALEARCPISFTPFAEDTQAMVSRLA